MTPALPAPPGPQLPFKLPGLGLRRLRNPHLLPLQLLGAAVGLGGAARLLLGRAAPAGATYYGFSFLYFALMNLTSIACHALADRGSRSWEVRLPLLRRAARSRCSAGRPDAAALLPCLGAQKAGHIPLAPLRNPKWTC